MAMLLLLAALVTVLSGLLLYMARSVGGSIAYGNGLRAVYAAESGANWALHSLRSGEIKSRKTVFSMAGTETRIQILNVIPSGGGWKGDILSRGVEVETKTKRFVRISFSVEEGNPRKIRVEKVMSTEYDNE